MTRYVTISLNISYGTVLNSVHHQTLMRVVLNDGSGTFDSLLTLVDNKLWMHRIDLIEDNLEPQELSLSESLATTSEIISRYQTIFDS